MVQDPHLHPRPADNGSAEAFWRRRPIAMRALVGTGFVLVLLLWLASGLDLLVRFTQFRTRSEHAWEDFNRTDQALANLRINVLLGAVNIRDALLDSNPESMDSYQALLEQNRQATADALAILSETLPPTERDSLAGLSATISDYWRLTDPLLESELPRGSNAIRRLLNTTILPRRQLGVTISDQIRAVNRSALESRQRDILATAEESQQRAWLTGTIALVLSLIVVVLVATYVGRLETQVRTQLARDVENTRSLQALSARLVRAQEEERRLIARELHDEVGQALTAVKLELAAAQRGKDPLRVAEALAEVKAIADDALQTVRNLSQLLRPPMLDALGLPETLAWYLKGFSSRTGIRTELHQVSALERASPEVETCVYRIVQEATTNVARHAGASTCEVTVQQLSESLLVIIEDDGCGFDPDAVANAPSRGVGLLSMTERVTGLGGTWRIDSRPGEGTRVTAELPVQATARPGATSGPTPQPEISSFDRGEANAPTYAR